MSTPKSDAPWSCPGGCGRTARKRARIQAQPAACTTVAVAGFQSVPRGCICTWTPDYTTIPATWKLTGRQAGCLVHRNAAGVTP